MRNSAVFILTHGRADKVITFNTLRRNGYTGKIYLIVDDGDKQLNRYIENFGEENIIIFNKQEARKDANTMDNFGKMNIVLYARNQCHRIAKELGLTHFLELDDDYGEFDYRFVENGMLRTRSKHKTLDKLFDAVYDVLDSTNAKTIALAQSGDFIGGANGVRYYKRVLRKAMNSFFCRTDRPFKFYGTINEDTTAYCLLGSRGDLFFTITEASLNQLDTQQNAGGLTDIYLDVGTYVKSFYSVMAMPSAVKVSTMGGGGNGNTYMRIHHRINWNNCVPKIIEQKWKK